MLSFKSEILIIGVNPYVLLPEKVLQYLFKQAGKAKGAIPVRGKLKGNDFIQTLVRYSGLWRSYLNGPMRTAAGLDVGDIAHVEIEFDPVERIIPTHPDLQSALNKNKTARQNFEQLSPSRQKEIKRYIASLKTEESVKKNVARAIKHLTKGERFVGR